MNDHGKRRRVHSDEQNPYLAHMSGNGAASGVNPLTDQPYSENYYRILNDRKKLPIYEARADVLRALKSNQVIVLEGETGSGKTTQVPQFLIEEGYADDSKIVCCTQPRRVAAMSVSKRVAEEMDVGLGEHVGYTIRFEDRTSQSTILKYLTDGMLLREAIGDHELSAYSAIVLDEAHERTLATDILLGLLKTVLPRRPDLKIIVMSATLDAGKFQDYFDGAPLLKVPGRLHPVSIYYSSSPEDDYVKAAVRTAIEIHRTEPPGDILIFLTGEEEIEDCVRKIVDGTRHMRYDKGRTIVLPLYSALPPDKQQRVFDRPPGPERPGGPPARKIICSTNVAETSLTIDGVVYVVDPGFSKQKIYNPRIRVESLLVQAISRASAKQRAGRAGRTRPGKCYRLYTEESFRDELTATAYPEILRSNLGNVVLQLKVLGITDLVHFDFMDPPAPETLMRALELLNYLGALDDEGELTEFGRQMAAFPLDPEHAACLINSARYSCSEDALSIIAMLSSAPNWFVRIKKDKQCEEARDAFVHSEGDHLTLLNVFNAYKRNIRDASNWCYTNYINMRAMRTADNVRTQLERIMKRESGVNYIQADDKESKEYLDSLKKALLSAFFQQVAYKIGKGGKYITCKDQQAVTIHPSCGLRYYPTWVMYHEFVFTKKQYIRTVTSVEGMWLIDIAPHYFDLENFPRGDCMSELQSLYRRKERVQRQNDKRKNNSSRQHEDNDAIPASNSSHSGKSRGGRKGRYFDGE